MAELHESLIALPSPSQSDIAELLDRYQSQVGYRLAQLIDRYQSQVGTCILMKSFSIFFLRKSLNNII